MTVSLHSGWMLAVTSFATLGAVAVQESVHDNDYREHHHGHWSQRHQVVFVSPKTTVLTTLVGFLFFGSFRIDLVSSLGFVDDVFVVLPSFVLSLLLFELDLEAVNIISRDIEVVKSALFDNLARLIQRNDKIGLGKTSSCILLAPG